MIDIEALAQALDFEVADVEMLLELFVESAQVYLANIEDAISGKDLSSIAESAHAIKGSASNLMLTEIQELARQMESAAKASKDIDYLSLYEQIDERLETLNEVHISYA
jgi:HPt (histidine-containing phosphotransfer) domain-containing protein